MSSKEPENNIKETCRVCLKNENLQSITDKYKNVDITEMLQTCLSIQFNENDGLPQKICTTCVSELSQAYNLSKKFQTTKTVLSEKLPQPVAIIQTVEQNTNANEFILPDKTIARPDIEVANKKEFVLVDRNIIKKIKEHDGRSELPSPSVGLTQAKMRIMNSTAHVVADQPVKPNNSLIRRKVNAPVIITNPTSQLKQALFGSKTPLNISLQLVNKSLKEPSAKINILNVQPYTANVNTILSDNNRNITTLQLNSVITNKKVETPKTKTNKQDVKENEKITTNKKRQSKEIVEPSKLKENKESPKKEINKRSPRKEMNKESPKKEKVKKSPEKQVHKMQTRKSSEKKQIEENLKETTTNIDKENTKKEIINNNTEQKLKERTNKSKWNTRNRIDKNYRTKKLKKKTKKNYFYSSAKYHEQFERFLTTSNDEGNKEVPDEKQTDIETETDTETEPEPELENIKEEPKIVPQTSTLSSSNLKTLEIKNKLVTGYVRRFQNNKECPICKKCFKYLEPHLRIHTSKQLATLKEINEDKTEKLLECKYCDRKFFHKNMLLNHEKIHVDKNRKFVCTVCDRGFEELAALQRHHNIHTHKNMYPCDICKTSFNIRSNLYRHQKVCALKNAKRQKRET